MNRLSTVAVRAFVRRRQPGKKLSDGAGLFLTITKNGTASWRLAYAYGGKERTIALGLDAPDFGVSEARKARDAARAQAAGRGRIPSFLVVSNG